MPVLALLVVLFLVYLILPFKATSKSVNNLGILLIAGVISFFMLRTTIYALPIIAIAILSFFISRKRFWKSYFAPAKIVKQEHLMDKTEAAAILGIAEGASPEEIKSAYHKLISKCHPDHGGSAYLASQINQAKAILLKD